MLIYLFNFLFYSGIMSSGRWQERQSRSLRAEHTFIQIPLVWVVIG